MKRSRLTAASMLVLLAIGIQPAFGGEGKHRGARHHEPRHHGELFFHGLPAAFFYGIFHEMGRHHFHYHGHRGHRHRGPHHHHHGHGGHHGWRHRPPEPFFFYDDSPGHRHHGHGGRWHHHGDHHWHRHGGHNGGNRRK